MDTWWKRNLTSPIINHFGRSKERKYFSRSPILIGGCARSGTSLMLSILSAHPNIFCYPHEVDAFTYWDDAGQPERLDRMYRYLITHRIPKSAHRWCEKRPYNVRYIPQLLNYFGAGFRFIHMIRDPRAVCTSIHPEDPNRFWVSPDRWIEDVTAAVRYLDHPRVFTVKFEELLEDNTRQVERICDFLREPVLKEIINWYEFAKVKENRAWFHSLKATSELPTRNYKEGKFLERIKSLRENQPLVELAAKFGYDLLA